MNESLKKAIEEIKAIEEYQRREREKEEHPLHCPLCGVLLVIKDDYESPHGVKLVFKRDGE